jgi:hypothetical protein
MPVCANLGLNKPVIRWMSADGVRAFGEKRKPR